MAVTFSLNLRFVPTPLRLMLFGVSLHLGSPLGWKLAGWLMPSPTNFSSLLWVCENPHLPMWLCLLIISWDPFFKFSTTGRIPGVGPGSNKMEMSSPYSFQKRILYHSSFPPILSMILKKMSESVLSLEGMSLIPDLRICALIVRWLQMFFLVSFLFWLWNWFMVYL